MRTLVISDLHLGGRLNTDVLRATAPRERLKEWIADADRLILLGDMIEFRHSPQRDALRGGLPVLADLAGALRKGAEIVVVPGNHDWSLLERWNADRADADQPAAPLSLSAAARHVHSSEPAAAVERPLGRRGRSSYPGRWADDAR